MNLYRAVYQPTDGTPRPHGMTFAAADAEQAGRIAAEWELPGDRLLTVRCLRHLSEQLELAA